MKNLYCLGLCQIPSFSLHTEWESVGWWFSCYIAMSLKKWNGLVMVLNVTWNELWFVKKILFNIDKNRCILSKIFNGDIKSHQQIHFKRIFSSTKRNLPTPHMGIEIIDRQQEISIIRLSNTCIDDCFVTPTTVEKRTTRNRMSTLWNS